MKRPKGSPRRFDFAPLTERHVCPVCQCQCDPGKQVPAIIANNQRLVREMRKDRILYGQFVKAIRREASRVRSVNASVLEAHLEELRVGFAGGSVGH